jgi:transposase-like protein
MTEHGPRLWEKWRAIVAEQMASGQSVAAFSKESGVTSSQVFAWRKRFREAEKAQFVEVQIKPAEPPQEIGIRPQAKVIEVRLCGGRSIAVGPGFDANHLRARLAVLEPEG